MDILKMGQVSSTWKSLSKSKVKAILKTCILKTFYENWETYNNLRDSIRGGDVDPSVVNLLWSEPHIASIIKFKKKLDKAIQLEELNFAKRLATRSNPPFPLWDIPMWEQHIHLRRVYEFSNSLRLIKFRIHLECSRDKIYSLLKFCLPQKKYILVDRFHKSIHSKTIFRLLLTIQNSL